MEPDNPLLDDYLLSLVNSSTPRVCFVPTASGDSDTYIVKFYDAFGNGRSTPTHLSLFRRSVDDLRSFILDQDIVYVGGGNTASMLAVWQVHGHGEVLREAWSSGVILCGLSAGSICWFEAGVTDSFGRELRALPGCLGILSGSHCPDYDGEIERRPAYQRLVSQGNPAARIAADDGVAIKDSGTEVAEVVSSRPDAPAYRVSITDG